MYPVLNASPLLSAPISFCSFRPSLLPPPPGRVPLAASPPRAPPNSLEWPMLFLPGNLSRLSDVFVSVKVWRAVAYRACVCAPARARPRDASTAGERGVDRSPPRCCAEVAARRKGFHRDSLPRKNYGDPAQLPRPERDLIRRALSRFNAAVRRPGLHLRFPNFERSSDTLTAGLVEYSMRSKQFS